MRLKDKIAIVTGGASGFGAGIVRKFHEKGAHVIIADINGEAAQDYAKTFDERSMAIAVDVSSSTSVEQMAEQVIEKFGRIDILVNNAGITHLPTPMEDVSEEDFDRVFSVNMKSVYLTAKYIVPHMKERKSGAILNVASTAGAEFNWLTTRWPLAGS